ncbi:hypothetical protein D3C80_1090180 [compost metagenome]
MCLQCRAGGSKAFDPFWQGIAVDGERSLRERGLYQAWQRMMQAIVANLAELAEHLKISPAFGQHAAGLEQQLVKIANYVDAGTFKAGNHGLIAAAFIGAIFFIEVHAGDCKLPAQFEQHGGGRIPGFGTADQQRDVQLGQVLPECAQIAQPEIHFAGGVIMALPLPWREQIHGNHRPVRAGGSQGGVIVDSQIAA